MRKVAIALLSLFLAGGAIAAQNTNAKPPKPKPTKPAVDCSKTDDATITTSVKEKLSKTPSLKDFAIDAATSAGVVTLTGSVKTGANKGLATRQAKRVPCVKKVDNQLAVEQKAAPPKPKAASKNAKM